MKYKPLSDWEKQIDRQIVDTVYTVHKQWGPGLLEKVFVTNYQRGDWNTSERLILWNFVSLKLCGVLIQIIPE